MRSLLAFLAVAAALWGFSATPFGKRVLAEQLGIGPYLSASMEPVAFTVRDREGRTFALEVPRAFLFERIAPGANLEPEIGVREVILSVDAATFEPCRRVEGCTPEDDVELSFPYPYELGDLDADIPSAESRASDVEGFTLEVAVRAIGDGADGPRTESRRYRASLDAPAPRLDCDMAVLQGAEGGVCRAAVRWRDGALIEMVMSADRRTRVHEDAEAAQALFDELLAP